MGNTSVHGQQINSVVQMEPTAVKEEDASTEYVTELQNEVRNLTKRFDDELALLVEKANLSSKHQLRCLHEQISAIENKLHENETNNKQEIERMMQTTVFQYVLIKQLSIKQSEENIRREMFNELSNEKKLLQKQTEKVKKMEVEIESLNRELLAFRTRELLAIAQSPEDMRKICEKNELNLVKEMDRLQQDIAQREKEIEDMRKICEKTEESFVKEMDLLQQDIAQGEEKITKLNISLQSVHSVSYGDKHELHRQLNEKERTIIILKQQKELLQKRVNISKETVKLLKEESAVTTDFFREPSSQLKQLIEKDVQLEQNYKKTQQDLHNHEICHDGTTTHAEKEEHVKMMTTTMEKDRYVFSKEQHDLEQRNASLIEKNDDLMREKKKREAERKGRTILDAEGTLRMTDDRAPSLVLRYNDGTDEGDILIQDVYVPKTGLAKNTFYCSLEWNNGIDGSGMCGIQDFPDGCKFMFYLFKPLKATDKIKAVYVGTGTKCEPFDGTGLLALNSSPGWEPDCWYTTMVRCSGKNKRSQFEFWVKNQVKQAWTHIATFENPADNLFFNTPTNAHIQDVGNSGKIARSVRFQNGFKRTRGGVWLPFSKAMFTVTPDKTKYKDMYDCNVTDRTFSLTSGGDTRKSPSAVEGKTLEWSMPLTKAADDTAEEP